MDICFSGEAYETFQRAVRLIEGYCVELTIPKPDGRVGESVAFDAHIVGADHDSEWGDALLYRAHDEDEAGPVGPIESARVERIFVY